MKYKVGKIGQKRKGKIYEVEVTVTYDKEPGLIPFVNTILYFSDVSYCESLGVTPLEEFEGHDPKRILDAACRVRNRWSEPDFPDGFLHPSRKWFIVEVYQTPATAGA